VTAICISDGNQTAKSYLTTLFMAASC